MLTFDRVCAQSTLGVTHFGHFALFHLMHPLMVTSARATGTALLLGAAHMHGWI